MCVCRRVCACARVCVQACVYVHVCVCAGVCACETASELENESAWGFNRERKAQDTKTWNKKMEWRRGERKKFPI